MDKFPAWVRPDISKSAGGRCGMGETPAQGMERCRNITCRGIPKNPAPSDSNTQLQKTFSLSTGTEVAPCFREEIPACWPWGSYCGKCWGRRCQRWKGQRTCCSETLSFIWICLKLSLLAEFKCGTNSCPPVADSAVLQVLMLFVGPLGMTVVKCFWRVFSRWLLPQEYFLIPASLCTWPLNSAPRFWHEGATNLSYSALRLYVYWVVGEDLTKWCSHRFYPCFQLIVL